MQIMIIRLLGGEASYPPGIIHNTMITDAIDGLLAFPETVTDDAGNSYTNDGTVGEAQAWHCIQHKEPSFFRLRFKNGDTISIKTFQPETMVLTQS